MFEKAKNLAQRAKCKFNSSRSTAMAVAGSAMAMMLGGPSFADDPKTSKTSQTSAITNNGGGTEGGGGGGGNLIPDLGDKGVQGNLDTIVTNAANAFVTTFMKWATLGAIVVFVLALLISIVSTDEKKIQQWRNIAKGVVIVWVIIMIAVPLFKFIYDKIGGSGAIS